jgi:hypothetical protein
MPALEATDPTDLEAKACAELGFLQLDPKAYNQKTSPMFKGGKGSGIMEETVVSPTAPRDKDGMFWGYATRLALLINAIFAECPYEGGYDLKWKQASGAMFPSTILSSNWRRRGRRGRTCRGSATAARR